MEKIQLVITFDPASGTVSVNGPIQNKMLCYGILKMAEKCVDSYEGKKSDIIIPRVGMPAGGN